MVRILDRRHRRAAKHMTERIEFLPWDSRFFGFRIARSRVNALTPAIAHETLQQCARERIQCLYFLARLDHAPTLRLAEASGFQLVDVRLDFVRKQDLMLPAELGLHFRPARIRDGGALGRLAMRSYPHSRFAADARFPRNAHKRLFREWVTRSITGAFDDCVWIAREKTSLAGFITCKRLAPGLGRIGLIGVAPRYRGRNVGTALIRQALTWFGERHLNTVTVATQGSNLAAQRLYQRCGFRSQAVNLWYHRWFDGTNAY